MAETKAEVETQAPPAPVVISAQQQNTLTLQARTSYMINGPYFNMPGRSMWRLKNHGPSDVWARWDGIIAVVDDPHSFVLDSGEIIQLFVGDQLSLACGNSGARVSLTISVNY